MLHDAGDPVILDAALAITPQIYRVLHRRIVTNVLSPGTLISESEIASEWNVSRQPVREAFIKLSEQGLVAVLPQRGTLVRKIDYASVLDARFLREAIEADIVSIVAHQCDTQLIASLRAQIVEQRLCIQRSPEEFNRLDDLFHLSLAEGAGKPGAWKLIEGLKSQMDRVRFLALEHFPITHLIDQHSLVVEQIAAGDVPRTEAAIRSHLRQVLSDLPAILAARPEYFDVPSEGIPLPVNTPSRKA